MELDVIISGHQHFTRNVIFASGLDFFNKYVMLGQHETSTKAGASNDVVYFSKLPTSLQIVICMLFDKFQVIFCTVKCTISQ